MAAVMDEVRQWQHEAGPGPATWQAAWERVISLVEPLWRDWTGVGSGEEYGEAASALAVAIYITASEQGIPVGEVTRADVEQLVDRPPAQSEWSVRYPKDLPERWGARLAGLGHDLEAQDDPVAVQWRRLCKDYPEPPMSFIDAGDASGHRVGHAVILGILQILAPAYKDHFRF